MAIAAVLAAVAAGTGAQAADEGKVVLQLRGPAQFEFAGYYAALWQGFYRDAGLQVEIKPEEGGEAADPARAVVEGRAQFGVGGGELVVRAAQGQPLLLLAPVFQRSGAEIYYRPDEDYASPGALTKATVGRLPASDILDIEMASALKAEGVDPDKINSVPLQPGEAIAALKDRRVDAVPGSAWTLPWLAHQQGLAVKSINPADYRVEYYGDTLFTLRRLADNHPALVRSFRDASLKGWAYAMAHADAIVARMLTELRPPAGVADPAGFDHYQAEVARSLARFPSIALGHSNPDRWNRIETDLAGVGALVRTADAGTFLYDPDAAARSRYDRRSFGILGATLAVGIALLVWFGWHRRQRPQAPQPATALLAAPSPAVPEPAAPPPRAPAPPVGREPAPADTAPTDLNAVLNRLDRAIRRRVPRRATCRLSLLPELWRCHAQPRSVQTLVLDLVAAGAADLKADGELVVGTRNYAFDAAAVAATPGAQLGEYVRVTVRDSGPGFPDEALDKVLDPAASPRPVAAAAAAAMRATGGFVRVESAEGIGTAVHLYFPRAVAPATQDKPAAAAE